MVKQIQFMGERAQYSAGPDHCSHVYKYWYYVYYNQGMRRGCLCGHCIDFPYRKLLYYWRRLVDVWDLGPKHHDDPPAPSTATT